MCIWRVVIARIELRFFYLTSNCSSNELSSSPISDANFLIVHKQSSLCLRIIVVSCRGRAGEEKGQERLRKMIRYTLRSYDPRDQRYDRYDSVESGSKEAYALSTSLIRLNFFPSRFFNTMQSIQAFGVFSPICIRIHVMEIGAFFPSGRI